MTIDVTPSAASPVNAVTIESFERALTAAAGQVVDRNAGLFGPGSLMWQVNREALVFLGASRAALLQVAHPGVAAAIDQHSEVTAHPLRRFRGTFKVVYRMVFGSWSQAEDAARRLRGVHDRIEGVDEHGEPYRANDRAALRWVYMTLIHTALMMYEHVLTPLSDADRDRYIEESKRFAYLFGLANADLESDWSAFDAAFHHTAATLAVSGAARRIAPFLLRGERPRQPPLPLPRWYSALTLWSLPDNLKTGFGVELSAVDEHRALRALGRARRIGRRLPPPLRHAPPYREARYRLAGHAEPSLSVRLGNRLWFGRSLLVSVASAP